MSRKDGNVSYIYRERDRQTDRDKERNQGKERFCDMFKVKNVLEVIVKVTFVFPKLFMFS